MKQYILGLIMAINVGCEQPQGYVGSCGKIAAEYREEFERECSSKVDRTLYNGALEIIVQDGKFALQQAGCKVGCEQWICGRGNYFGPQGGKYSMNVFKNETCYR